MQFRAGAIVLAVVVMGATACNDDGRTLRPAEPDQNASVSTLSPETTESTIAVTLPVEPTLVTTMASDDTTDLADLTVTSTAFADGSPIPATYTCQGDNVSPPLTWSPAPTETVEIAITMEDLDAPGYVHWAVAALDPASTSLGEGAVPEFAINGLNGAGQPGYTGPCPPPGETHTYRITVHYLSEQTELADGGAGADLEASIAAGSLASASITGTYSQS